MCDLRRAALALAVAVGLAGCRMGSSEATVDRSPPLLTIGADGAGDLTASTPFSREAVAAALPDGFVLEESQILTEADSLPIPVLYAFRDGEIMLEVSPDASLQQVGRIDAASAAVADHDGLRPGATFVEADGDDMACEPGRGDLSGRAVCSRGGALRYVFAHGAASTAETLPDPEVLRQSILERIVWTAP